MGEARRKPPAGVGVCVHTGGVRRRRAPRHRLRRAPQFAIARSGSRQRPRTPPSAARRCSAASGSAHAPYWRRIPRARSTAPGSAVRHHFPTNGPRGRTGNSTPTPNTVPDDIATFANSANTLVTISSSASINTIQFTAAAPAYSFTINPFLTFSINGAGISNSSAFAPSFANNAGLMFFNSGTAANAAITNNGGISFLGSSSAGSSTIINSGFGSLIAFSDTSTAGNATITTNGGAQTLFSGSSDGGTARFITNAGGIVNFSGSSGPLGDGNISAGSIEGAGTYQLGTNRLIVGSNNLSTTVSGSIQDGGTNGSFTKTGAGTLTLTGTLNIGGDLSLCNCQTGGLVISGGSATVGSFVEVDGGTLTVTNGGTLQTVDILAAANISVSGAGSDRKSVVEGKSGAAG